MSAAVAMPENEREAIGGNNPPAPTPFEQSKEEIEDLWLEAKNWLDGSKVTSEVEATAISKLKGLTLQAENTAEARRKAEAKPFDDGKAEVQKRYAPLTSDTKAVKGKTVLIKEACDAALAPWLQAKEDAIKAAAAEARRIADAQAAAAVEAIRAARQGEPNLEARETAEALLVQAKHAEADARRAENTKAHATGGTRAIGLRSVWKATMTDPREAAKHYWLTRHEDVEAFFQRLADADVHAGKREIPGFNVVEERVL